VEIPTPITTSTTLVGGGGTLKAANPIAAPSLATMAGGTHFILSGPSPFVDLLHLGRRQELFNFLLGLITVITVPPNLFKALLGINIYQQSSSARIAFPISQTRTIRPSQTNWPFGILNRTNREPCQQNQP
jgi:hypothetical protein